jgi:gluconolactonase
MNFPMPPIIKPEIFARLPQRFRTSKQKGTWARGGLPGAADKDCFLEGPSFDLDGNLYFVDIPFGRVFRLDTRGEFDLIAEYDGEPNGLKIHKDGRIFLADHKQGLLLLDPKSGKVMTFMDGPPKERFKGVNDMVFAANGDLYFTDQGRTSLLDPTGRVYRLRASGQLDLLLNNVPSPNGIALDPAETTLYVAVTYDPSVWKVGMGEDGTPLRASPFVRCLFGGSPDGLAVDEAGNLAVTRFMYQETWLFSKRCVPLCRIVPDEEHYVTNLAYGGPDNRTLYITECETGTILTAKMEVPGKVMYSHQ